MVLLYVACRCIPCFKGAAGRAEERQATAEADTKHTAIQLVSPSASVMEGTINISEFYYYSNIIQLAALLLLVCGEGCDQLLSHVGCIARQWCIKYHSTSILQLLLRCGCAQARRIAALLLLLGLPSEAQLFVQLTTHSQRIPFYCLFSSTFQSYQRSS